MSHPVALRALLGDYPVTHALRHGAVTSPIVTLQFAEISVPAVAFKRVVRDLEFDVAELPIVTFLLAKAFGKPLVLLPAVVLGRFQHRFLVYDRERGPLTPGDLRGRRVGVRSYTVTTATWLRGILHEEWGIDPDSITWVTFEEPHVAEFRDPPGVQRAGPGKELVAMLLAGELDAAVVSGREPRHPRLAPLIADPLAAARAWWEKHQAIQINHMVTVRASLSRAQPQVAREVYHLLAASKRAEGPPPAGMLDPTPLGVEANRRNLEVAIDYAYRQRLIPRRFRVEELFDDATRGLDAS